MGKILLLDTSEIKNGVYYGTPKVTCSTFLNPLPDNEFQTLPNWKSLQTTISNLTKMAERYPNRWKTLWEKEKLLVTSNFSFSHSVFKRLVSQGRQKVSLCGNGLICKFLKLFRFYDVLFRFYEIIFRFHEILFRFYEIIFRFHEILFRKNEILFRKNKILFREYEITLPVCEFKKAS